jgi:hypothetical protein
MIDLEILTLHTICHEGLVIYHKANGIIVMKNHVKMEHKVLYARYLEGVSMVQCIHGVTI